MLKIFITSVIVLAAALPASAQVGPGLGRTDNISSTPESYGQICTNDSDGSLSMRSGPGRNFGKLKEISNGEGVTLMGGKYSQDGFWWWRISHDGDLGWVRADYVCNDPQ